ncbi:MAG: dipeptidase [Cutibacterium granulosum]|uniref:dipeptidase n=1 Tax=Cutibacterium granulosum TaxID=33011 RepID=UPI002B231EC7|nr:dipeptidase [Cutibacterium granulosum]MEA5635852.1 dipeptidase [Cutibacterium granulosum]
MDFTSDLPALRAKVDELADGAVEQLSQLMAIQSVSSLNPDGVNEHAQAVADAARAAGAADATVVSEAGGLPAVIAHWPAPQGQPTILLYSHGDVQPTGDVSQWHSEPFVATKRGERLFGRGSADDKGGVVSHLTALKAFDGNPPVGVTLFVEHEEEIGSPSMTSIIEAHKDELAADVIVVADSVNWDQGEPSVTTTLRGVADCAVELRTLDHPLHSGQFGGVVPDALTAMCKLLATLHDENGDVAVAGLHTAEPASVEYPEERLRTETAILDGVDWLGTGNPADKMWTRPSLSVLAIDATPVAEAINILPSVCRAKVGLRVAPGGDATQDLEALMEHLRTHAPYGAQVEVTPGEAGAPGVVPFEGLYAEIANQAFKAAWGTEPVQMGTGGAIPLITDLQHAFPQATVLVTAVTDPDSRMHGLDESLHLGDFRKAILTEALILAGMAK